MPEVIPAGSRKGPAPRWIVCTNRNLGDAEELARFRKHVEEALASQKVLVVDPSIRIHDLTTGRSYGFEDSPRARTWWQKHRKDIIWGAVTALLFLLWGAGRIGCGHI